MKGTIIKALVVTMLLLCVALSMGCLEEEEQTYVQEPKVNVSSVPEIITEPTELDMLVLFLKEDKTDEVNYTGGQKGINYFVCSGFSRQLAQNASKYNITMGAISLRETPTVGVCTKYYHAMNYVIVDDSFIIIEPQTDEVFYLDLIGYHHDGVYRYISIYENAQMMSNYGKGRETVDIDLMDYNETYIVNKWRR